LKDLPIKVSRGLGSGVKLAAARPMEQNVETVENVRTGYSGRGSQAAAVGDKQPEIKAVFRGGIDGEALAHGSLGSLAMVLDCPDCTTAWISAQGRTVKKTRPRLGSG
jgi:hypothetical protein